MQIPRVHLFELEDQPWFPAVIRDLVTDYIRFVEAKFSLHRPALPLLSAALRETGADRVIDLCSGAGGPILLLQRGLMAEGFNVFFTMTDRFPNSGAMGQVAADSGGAISFVNEPIDAGTVPRELKGFRTIFNAFHHFAPDRAVAVLSDAVRSGQPIGVFEIPDRTLGNILPMALLTPALVMLATPFIRPFRWSRILWTYLLPLVPLTCWWDGVISQLRAYTPGELEGLAQKTGAQAYVWRAGRVPLGSTPGYMNYLIGRPENEQHINGQ